MLFRLKNSFPTYYRYYGRRIAKRLSPSLSNVFENNYDQFSIDKDILNIISNKSKNKNYILNKNFKKNVIEIGFGDGEHLLSQVQSIKTLISLDVKFLSMAWEKY